MTRKIKIFLSPLYILKKRKQIKKIQMKLDYFLIKNEVIIFTRKKITLGTKEKVYLINIWIFFYKKKFLKNFSKLKKIYLEQDQKLEQLRVIENGFKIIAFQAKSLTQGIDSYKDLQEVRKKFK